MEEENNLNEETEVALPPQEEETNDVELPAPPENESVVEETAEASENVEQEITEEELQQKKNKTQDRINALTRKRREAEEREAAALEYVEVLHKKVTDLESKNKKIDVGFTNEFESRVASEEDQARKALTDATELNDPIKIAEATSALAKVEINKERLRVMKNRQTARPAEQPLAQTPQQNAAPQPQPNPDPKAESWAATNTWFGNDRKLTAVAMDIHTELIDEGFDGSTDGYYEELNKRINPWLGTAGVKTPDVTGEETEIKRGSSPVAPVNSGRSVAKKPKSVRLTKSQVDIAKRLGILHEQSNVSAVNVTRLSSVKKKNK